MKKTETRPKLESAGSVLKATFTFLIISILGYLFFIKTMGIELIYPNFKMVIGALILGVMAGLAATLKIKFYKGSEDNLYTKGNICVDFALLGCVVLNFYLGFLNYSLSQILFLGSIYMLSCWSLYGVGHSIRYRKAMAVIRVKKETQL